MQATIISVGSEILRGSLLDTNAQYFAQELTSIGLEVVRVSQAPDDLDAITAVLREAMRISDVVVISGGLGPTEDDLTREAIIALTGEEPIVDPAAVEAIRALFARRHAEMPERNEKQAWMIPSATVIPNHHGTAPGWFVEYDDRLIAVLPGPPRENRPMWELQFRPLLVPRSSNQAIVTRTIKTIGIGESAVADALDDIIQLDWPVVGTYAKSDGVHISVTAIHDDRLVADAAVRSTMAEAMARLEPHVYGVGDEPLAVAVTQPLVAAGIKLALYEIGTAGSLSTMLLGDPQAQEAVDSVRISPERRRDHSSVSPVDLARDLAATQARSRDVGTIAVVVLDIDDSDRQLSSGELGLALAHPGGLRTSDHRVHGTPEEMRRRAGLLAAEFFWREFRIAAGLQRATC